MRIYSIGAFLKILLGIGILAILYNYVNVYQDPSIGLPLGFLGVFMIIWGVSYYGFLIAYSVFTTDNKQDITSKSYKLSLMLGVYTMLNLTLVITGHRTKLIGIALLLVFVGFQVSMTYKSKSS